MSEKQLKIVLIGGPGTGKTSVIKELEKSNFLCFHEISRKIISKAQKDGIEQLFLKEPILFSEMLLEGREKQFLEADKQKNKVAIFDRGIPDILAYLNYSKSEYPIIFKNKCLEYNYDLIFHFAPWKEIHENDSERYETFDETKIIDKFLIETYSKLNYTIINVPFGSIKERKNYILNMIKFHG